MYDKVLDSFIAAAELGSFSKAAEKLHFSTTALAKQMNALEAATGLSLFVRTKRGVALTDAGRAYYEDAKLMVRFASDALTRALNEQHKGEKVVRIGTSVMRSGKRVLDLWASVSAELAQTKMYIVPFDDDYRTYIDTMKNIGKNIDVICGIYPQDLVNETCNVLHLEDLPIKIAMSKNHPLAGKAKLGIADIYGESIILAKRGPAPHIDAVRDELERHAQIHIIDTPYYDVGVFNRCYEQNILMLAVESWTDVHPLLTCTSVDWDFTAPYGIIYPKSPTAAVLEFINIVERTHARTRGNL